MEQTGVEERSLHTQLNRSAAVTIHGGGDFCLEFYNLRSDSPYRYIIESIQRQRRTIGQLDNLTQNAVLPFVVG